jgi:UDP-N-acetylmuramoylalanine--D-glutamate ligase
MMREPTACLLPTPVPTELQGKRVLVLGLGDTGLSVARWVERQGGRVRVADTRALPPRQAEFAGELHHGAFAASLLEGIDLVCISPGISLEEKIVRDALERRIPVLGDIELFAWRVRAGMRSKVIAITGTNGKSTVTSLTGHLLRAAGVDCEVAGNIGPAALSALANRTNAPAVWVLELSSYQLETTWSLAPDAAAMLNLSEDHLDRYAGLDQYSAAKARIFQGDGVKVVNRADPRSMAMVRADAARMSFGIDAPARVMDFGVRQGTLVQGDEPILAAEDLPIRGTHNVSNALAACALARAMGVTLSALTAGLGSFRGLPHRLELVATRRGVEWYDDSKGTNVGATVAALSGLRSCGPRSGGPGKSTILIAGGDGKGQDFSPLAAPVKEFAKLVLLIGRDALLIEKALAPTKVPIQYCASLEQAVEVAAREALPGDAVLLSPACASFDMFRDYRQRGERFASAVTRLAE